MWLSLLPALWLPFIGLCSWQYNRLRRAVAERHPCVENAVDAMARQLPRGQRKWRRVNRYRMLHDSVIDRHIHAVRRAEIAATFAWLSFVVVIVVLLCFAR